MGLYRGVYRGYIWGLYRGLYCNFLLWPTRSSETRESLEDAAEGFGAPSPMVCL